MSNKKRVVITGGPGFGKTSIIKRLKRERIQATPDYARMLIDGFKLKPAEDHLKFQSQWLELMLAGFNNTNSQTTLFEYGFPDIIAYFRWRDGHSYSIPQQFIDAAQNSRFEQVFILRPIDPLFFEQDYARVFTYEKSIELDREICRAWDEFGYKPTLVPNIKLESRVSYIRGHALR